ncbi:sigma-54 interaction domain-containing protein [Halomonas elongata]|uniref:sigma-54 interaction domain-containing protein n=1 Tax=Halomonas elongata TaxID=2746 RepID=UPI002E28E018|nr:sigma-54 dependent transcriptional regulator [Halomonas elongata]WVI70894.1 sigma-54 dependent transcriptional regulator [Halomonas elongata]
MESPASVRLFCRDSDRDASLGDTLRQRGWQVHNDTIFESSGACCCHEHVTENEVGLMMLDALSSDELRRLEASMIKSRCPWIGLVDESGLADGDTRRLIINLCLGYAMQPVDADRIEGLLWTAADLMRLQRRENESQKQAATEAGADSGEYEMVGTTPAMWQLFKTIRKIAAVDASVCIHGESGTGKELTAQAIHERSPRANGPFHAINCGALPDNLIQSELFGHEKGAFTGAGQRKIGRIEAASGGTLFLDEIGDLPLELQVNLLRFLETRRLQRVGGLNEISVDVRILAATHVDLAKAVDEGRFREDLYHRLNVLQITVPALREHPEDIEILAHFFFKRFAGDKPACLKGFSRESLAVMQQYAWPGNVRELINRVRRAMVMCEGRLIQPEDLGIERRRIHRHVLTLEQARERAERDSLLAALARNKYRIHPAAAELGVSRVTMYRLLNKHGIPRSPGESASGLGRSTSSAHL